MALSDRTKERLFYALTDRISQEEVSDLMDELEAYKEARVLSTATTLYVTTAGSDTSGDGSINNPYRNPQAALNSLVGVHITAAVTVSVGAGTFDGFTVPALVCTVGGSVTVAGTTANATPATGTATGTWTSTSSGVGNDTGQAWTVNDLKGKLVQCTVSGVTNYLVIASNTATAITLCVSGTPTNATTYTILDNVSVLSGNAVIPGVTLTTCIGSATVGVPSYLAVTAKNFVCTPSGSSQRAAYCSGVTQILLDQIVFNISNGAQTANFAGTVVVSNCFFSASVSANAITNITAAAPGYVNVTGTLFRNTASSGAIVAVRGSFQITASVFDVTVASGSAIILSSVAQQPTITLTSCTFLGALSAISVSLPCFVNVSGTPVTVSSGNTSGIVASKGARVQVASTVALGATNEISVDGAVTTLAAMRALTPKAYPATPNAYGTVIFE